MLRINWLIVGGAVREATTRGLLILTTAGIILIPQFEAIGYAALAVATAGWMLLGFVEAPSALNDILELEIERETWASRFCYRWYVRFVIFVLFAPVPLGFFINCVLVLDGAR